MSKFNRSEDLMDAWHRGELSDSDKLELDALSQDTEILAEQELQVEIMDALDHKGREQLRLEMQQWSKERIRKSIPKNIFLWSAIAASICLGILIFFFQLKSLDLQVYEEPFPNVISSTHRTLSTSSSSEIAAVMKPYDMQDWQSATDHISNFLSSNSEPEALYLYLGISAYHLESFSTAQSALEHLLENSEDATFLQPAQWFLALTYIKLDDTDQAKKILSEIFDTQHYRSKDAGELLKKL